MSNFMNGMCGKLKAGWCRLSMSGGIAVKTSSGEYKSYDVETGRLTNCTHFVFPNIGEDFFFVFPTSKVDPGDIIIVDEKPRCVVEVKKNEIVVINYDNSTKETIIPERHMMMGNAYFYGKVVSIFGSKVNGKKGLNKIMKFMLMSEMMKGSNNASSTGTNNTGNMLSSMLPMMMLMNGNGGFDSMFSGMFDSDDDDDSNPLKGLTDLIAGTNEDESAKTDKEE